MGAMLPFATNEDLAAEDQARRDALEPPAPSVDDLAAYALRVWSSAKDAKHDIEERLLKCDRQRQSEYEPKDLAAIKAANGPDIYMRVTSIKCRAIEAALNDAILPAGERPFTVSPSPVPDLGTDTEQTIGQMVAAEATQLVQAGIEVSEQQIADRLDEVREMVRLEERKRAKRKAERQEDQIDDAFTEGGFYDAIRKFIKSYCTHPTAFLMGPEVRRRKRLAWVASADGRKLPSPADKVLREFEWFSAYDVYPGPGARSLQDGPLCLRRRLRRKDLLACFGVPGFSDDAIQAVLDEHGQGGLNHWLWTDQERARLEARPHEDLDPEAMIDAVEVWADIAGYMLREWGMPVPSLIEDYAVRMWLIGRHVVMARVNPHPLGNRPIYSASWEEINDSVWGIAPPEIIRDCQRVCNAAARSAVENMGIAGLPQVEVYKKRLEAAETDIENIYGGKIWQTKDTDSGTNNPAVRFFQPQLVAPNLMEIFDRFYQQAGEQIGVPAYEHGSTEASGAGETASGLSMLLNQSSKVMKDAVRHIDNGIIAPAVEETWLHIVLYDDPEDAGDIHVVARASEYMLVYERLQILRRDWLNATNNPTDMAIIGIVGRAAVLREQARQLRMPVDEIIPSEREMEQKVAEMQAAAEQQAQAEAVAAGGQERRAA